MGTLLHFKNVYLEAFENCKPAYLVVLLKIYSLFSLIMISMALYAFFYRAINGFEF
ncbi:DUF6747 family protein [Cellulophaga sp. HaHaR_3_176]|uniref:DUF6747 family protein n=1 Tax=Cellulophaga sp. HaHaR_3_176 TaxID=1942464 RepID=UPI00352EC95C